MGRRSVRLQVSFKSRPMSFQSRWCDRHGAEYGLSDDRPSCERLLPHGIHLTVLRERGLVQSIRNAGNQRRHHRSALRRISVIRIAQGLGLALTEIDDALVRLPDGRTPTRRGWGRLSKMRRCRVGRSCVAARQPARHANPDSLGHRRPGCRAPDSAGLCALEGTRPAGHCRGWAHGRDSQREHGARRSTGDPVLFLRHEWAPQNSPLRPNNEKARLFEVSAARCGAPRPCSGAGCG